MFGNKELRLATLETRVSKLKSKPTENAALIKKAERQIRKLKTQK